MNAPRGQRRDYSQRRTAAADRAERAFEDMFIDFESHAGILRVLVGNQCIPDGRLATFMASPSHPPGVDFIFWLFDDLEPIEATTRAILESDLFTAGVFCQTTILLDDALSRRDPALGAEIQWTRHALIALAHGALSRACVSEAGQDRIATAWSTYGGAQAWYVSRHMNRARPYDIPGDLRRLARRAAPMRLPCVFGLLALGRPALVDGVIDLIDGLHAELHLLTDILNLRTDLAHQIHSAPIVAVMRASLIPLDGPIDELCVLGASVLNGVIGQMAGEARQRLADLAGAATALGLPTFAAYAHQLRERLEDAAALFDPCLSG